LFYDFCFVKKSDVLIILSGNQIAYLDPDWILTKDGGDAEDLNVICNTKYCETIHSQKEMESVYILRTFLSTFHDIFMYKRNSTFYNGTLIRLPLRQGRDFFSNYYLLFRKH
jgi:hypothetical protein